MYIVIVDARNNNGHCLAIMDDDDNIMQFDTKELAEECMEDHALEGFPYIILDLDSGETWL